MYNQAWYALCVHEATIINGDNIERQYETFQKYIENKL